MSINGVDGNANNLVALDNNRKLGSQFDGLEEIAAPEHFFQPDASGINDRRLAHLEFDQASLQKQQLSSKLSQFVEQPTKLHRGARGGEVQSLQENLIDCGYLTKEQQQTGVGIFGKFTERAMRQFQKDNHLSPSGVYDFATQQAMTQLKSGVQFGIHGNVVHGLQQRLAGLGLMTNEQIKTGPGIFGPKTEAALKAFQSSHGLKADGVLNQATFQMLKKADDNRIDAGGAVKNTSSDKTGNRFIADAALRLIDKKGVVNEPGLCSKFARYAVGDAYKQNPYEGKFGGYFGGSANVSAKNFENSRYKVQLKPGEKPQVGDLLFKYDSKNGHVGIYIGDNKVAENSTSRYTKHTDGYKGIRSLDKFGQVDVVVRLPAPKG